MLTVDGNSVVIYVKVLTKFVVFYIELKFVLEREPNIQMWLVFY